jgi:hypothetical protein
MNSFIYNYCGTWKDQEGNLLLIEAIDDRRVSVTYVKAGEDKPALRPWFDGAPAANMIGSYDPGWEPSLDIELAKPGDGFCLNLSLDATDGNYTTISPSIIRNAEDGHLEKYYGLFGALSQYSKCE